MQQQPWAQISPLLKPLTEGGAYKRLIGSMKGEQTKLSLFGMPENGKVPLVLFLHRNFMQRWSLRWGTRVYCCRNEPYSLAGHGVKTSRRRGCGLRP